MIWQVMLLKNAISLSGLTGEVVAPNDEAYNEARQEWNKAIQKYPLAIVYCRNKSDVRNAVLWSRKNEVSLRIRSGGHNYEGYSTGNGVLVIDLSQMNALKIDRDANLLYVEGGTRLGELYRFVASKGYPFPGGTCPTVGVSGYALGGGWGLSCRLFGLGCDSLTEIELVDYRGNILKANQEQNTDLFWACRGAGGGNFGVVVSMIFRLPPKTDMVTLVGIDYPNADQWMQVRFLNTWQYWLKEAPEEITLVARLYNSGNEGYELYADGIFYGTPDEARKIMKPFTCLGGARLKLEYMTFIEAVTRIGEVYPDSEKFNSASRFVSRDFSSEEIMNLVGLVTQAPPGSVLAGISLYALGGRVKDIDPRDTAFFYRDARYIMWIQSTWEIDRYAEVNAWWVEDGFRYIKRLTEGSYVNFPYSGLRDYLFSYYGYNVDRLREVKKQYDPENVFRFPQSIKS